MPFIAYGEISNWEDIKNYLNSNRFAYVIWERIDAIKCDRWEDTNINDLQDTTEGLLFGDKAELKWKKRDNGFHLTIISDEDESTKAI